MAAETYVLKFRADGTVQVTRQLKGVGAAAAGAAGATNALNLSMKMLARTAAILSSYLGVAALIRTSDAYTNLSNKIRIVTQSEEHLVQTREQLRRISRDARADMEGTATLYQRITLANRNLNKSEEERLNFVSAISKSLAISGATAAETNSVMIQLSQGLGSIAVRGEELRAVMEAAPRLVKALGDSTGYTLGEIKELTAQGKFLSKDFFEAILKQLPSINADFAKLNPTLSQAGRIMKNEFTVVIGKFNELTGSSANLAKGILDLSKNLELVLGAAIFLAAAGLVQWASQILISIRQINLALTATVGLLLKTAMFIGGIYSLSIAFRVFFDETKKGQILLTRLSEEITKLQYRMQNWKLGMQGEELEEYKDGLQEIIDSYSRLLYEIEIADFGDQSFFDKMLVTMKEDAEKIKTIFMEAGEAIATTGVVVKKSPWEVFARDFETQMERIISASKTVGQVFADTIGEAIRGVSDELAELALEGEADFKRMAKSIIKDFISMIIQAQMFKMVQGIGGMFGASFGAPTAPTPAAQFGRNVTGGSPVLVGERRPEIFVPHASGRVEPRADGAGGGGPNIRIVNAVSGDAILRAASSSVVDRIVMNSISRNSGSVRGIVA